MKKYACVTGADRGLGLSIVEELVKHNFHVFAGRFLQKWNLLDALQERYPDNISIIEVDVSSDESVRQAARSILKHTDSIDILVNNAGIGGKFFGTVFDELDFEDMLKVFNVNALGALRMTNTLITAIMTSYHKLIVNISSEAGSIGTCWRYEGFGYCMSKAALNMSSAIIHNSLHREFNGQVMNFNPGGMATHFGNPAATDDQKPLAKLKAFATPEESAKGIVELMLAQERFKSDHPAFLSFGGDRIPW